MTLSQEKIFYHYLRENIIYFKYVEPHFFDDKEVKQLYRLDRNFLKKYNEIATKEQLSQIIERKQVSEFFYV